MKYRKKSVEVEAIQWVGPEPDPEVELFLGEAFETWLPSKQQLELRAAGGAVLWAFPGDYIVRDDRRGRDHYPCSRGIFEMLYEAAK